MPATSFDFHLCSRWPPMCNHPSQHYRSTIAGFCWWIRANCFLIARLKKVHAATNATHSLVLSERWFYISLRAVEFSMNDNWKVAGCGVDFSYGCWEFLLEFLGTTPDYCKGCFLNCYYHFWFGEMLALYCSRRVPTAGNCLEIWKKGFAPLVGCRRCR